MTDEQDTIIYLTSRIRRLLRRRFRLRLTPDRPDPIALIYGDFKPSPMIYADPRFTRITGLQAVLAFLESERESP